MGKLSALKLHEKYETGQFFLHRVFGYRGVVLFPWRAKVYDRNPYTSTPDTNENVAASLDLDSSPDESLNKSKPKNKKSVKNDETTIDDTDSDTINGRSDSKKEVTVKVQSYYQVLVDSRDCPHVVSFQHKYNDFIFFRLGGKITNFFFCFLFSASTNRGCNLSEPSEEFESKFVCNSRP